MRRQIHAPIRTQIFKNATNQKYATNLHRLKHNTGEHLNTCAFQVGGPGFSKVIKLMNRHGRVAVCGAISTYNATEPVFRMYLHSFKISYPPFSRVSLIFQQLNEFSLENGLHDILSQIQFEFKTATVYLQAKQQKFGSMQALLFSDRNVIVFILFITVEDFLWKIIRDRIKIHGFHVRQFAPEWPAGRKELVKWIKEVCFDHCFSAFKTQKV